MTSEESDYIVVTGFGPWAGLKSNPSWDSIKDGRLQIERSNIKLLTRKISVEYKVVDKEVLELWRTYKPILMVHVGLAAKTNCIKIEKLARHGPYIQDDKTKDAPHKELRANPESIVCKSDSNATDIRGYVAKPCQFDCSKTCFDVDKVCDKLNKLHALGKAPVPFAASDEAGLYLCEYIYHKSLEQCDKTVFVHVPDVSDNIKLDDISASLKCVIEALLDELNEIPT